MRAHTHSIRRALVGLTAAGIVLAACGGDDESANDDATTSEADSTDAGSTGAGSTGDGDAADTEAASGDLATCADGKTISDGTLTIATGEPAFPPYVIDDDPTNGKGFEAAVGYAIADQLGFSNDQVTWIRTTFDEAIQPGPKNFDLNMQQYTITPERSESVSFSSPYYTSNQAILGLEGSAAIGATSVADLSQLKFGVMAGTTSKEFVDSVIAPSDEPFVYDDNVAAKAGLESNQVDAIVVDLPTAFYISAVEIEGSSVIAQFPTDASTGGEQWGAVFEKDNPLAGCVDQAIAALTESGDLESLTTEWMSSETDVPVLTVG